MGMEIWRMATREWHIGNGKWKCRMENGEWEVGNGEWRLTNGE